MERNSQCLRVLFHLCCQQFPAARFEADSHGGHNKPKVMGTPHIQLAWPAGLLNVQGNSQHDCSATRRPTAEELRGSGGLISDSLTHSPHDCDLRLSRAPVCLQARGKAP